MPNPAAAELSDRVIATPLGPMLARSDGHALRALTFLDAPAAADAPTPPAAHAILDRLEVELAAYFAGTLRAFTIPFAPVGTPFQHAVWNALVQIPAGRTRSYAAVAAAIGRPSATRAVARANATNPLAIVIPCHRVIGRDGTLTGYAGGLNRKQRLLDLERAGCPEPASLFG